MSRSISKAGAEELKVLSSASAGAILTFGSADSELKVNLIGNRVYFVSIRGNFTEKSTLLYRLALLVINSFKPLKKPHPNILTFGRVTDAEFGAGRDVHVLRWQLCCKPTELYLWDPTKLNIQPKYEPACLNCGTKAGGDGWAQSVRQLIGLGDEDVWFFSKRCECKGCLKAKAGGGTVKAGFHLSDPEYLVQMTQAAQLQFPGTVTHSSGVTRALMSKLTLGVDGIGISRFCKERNELAMGCYATAQLEYYSMLAPQPRSAGQQQQQLITSYLGRARGGEASGSAAAVEDEAATLEFPAFTSAMWGGELLNPAYASGLFRDGTRELCDHADKYMQSLGGVAWRADGSFKNPKLISGSEGCYTTVMNEKGQIIGIYAGTGSIKQLEGPFKLLGQRVKLGTGQDVAVIYVDNCRTVGGVLRGFFPTLGASDVKEDVFHVLRRVGDQVPDGHSCKAMLLEQLSDAVFVMMEEDELLAKSMGWEVNRTTCRHVIPQPDVLVERLERVVGRAEKMVDSSTGQPLMTAGVAKQLKSMCQLAKEGLLSDPPDRTMHVNVEAAGKPPKWVTLRGTSALEGFHKHFHDLLVGGKNSQEYSESIFKIYIHRWNRKQSFKHDKASSYGTFDYPLLQKVNAAARAAKVPAPYPDAEVPEPEVEEKFFSEWNLLEGPQALALREAGGSAAAASTSRFRLVRALDDVAALKLSRYVKKGSPADFCKFFAAGTDTDEVEGQLLMQLKQHGWWVTCEDDELPALHKIELIGEVTRFPWGMVRGDQSHVLRSAPGLGLGSALLRLPNSGNVDDAPFELPHSLAVLGGLGLEVLDGSAGSCGNQAGQAQRQGPPGGNMAAAAPLELLTGLGGQAGPGPGPPPGGIAAAAAPLGLLTGLCGQAGQEPGPPGSNASAAAQLGLLTGLRGQVGPGPGPPGGIAAGAAQLELLTDLRGQAGQEPGPPGSNASAAAQLGLLTGLGGQAGQAQQQGPLGGNMAAAALSGLLTGLGGQAGPGPGPPGGITAAAAPSGLLTGLGGQAWQGQGPSGSAGVPVPVPGAVAHGETVGVLPAGAARPPVSLGPRRLTAFTQRNKRGASRCLTLADSMRDVCSNAEKQLFWELHGQYARGSRTDWAGMTQAWNARVLVETREGRGAGLYLKQERHLKKYANESLKQITERDSLALLQFVGLQPSIVGPSPSEAVMHALSNIFTAPTRPSAQEAMPLRSDATPDAQAMGNIIAMALTAADGLDVVPAGGNGLGVGLASGNSLGVGPVGGNGLVVGLAGGNSLGVGLAGGSGLGAGQAGGNGPGVGQASGDEFGMELAGSNSLGVGLAGGSGLGAGQAGGNGPGVGQASGNESGMELAGGNGQGVGQVIGNGPDTRGGSAAGALASLRFAGAPALPVPKRSRATATVLAGQKPGAGQGGKDIAKSCRKCGVLIRDKCKHVLERLAKKQKTGE